MLLPVMTDRPSRTLAVKLSWMPMKLALALTLSIETSTAVIPTTTIPLPLTLLLAIVLEMVMTAVPPDTLYALTTIPSRLAFATTWSMTPLALGDPLGG